MKTKNRERMSIRELKKQINSSTPLKTGIYVRVSTDEQAQEGFSIRGQTEKLKSYALLKEWDIYDIYSDEGISGKNIVDRPAINRLIDDINEGKVNNVLVFKVDRLTRSTKNLIELVELFEEKGCVFNSLTESIDTDTPSGRMFLKIIGIFAEFERENLISRLKLGFERKVKEGYTLATHSVSYGYDRPKGQKIQSINKAEAKIVKEIFNMFVNENMSRCGIASNLNRRKVQAKQSGSTWDSTKIKDILTNPNYIGKVRYSVHDEKNYFETEGQHESIISDELFALAQEKLTNSPRLNATKKPKDQNYFCGILYCCECGSKFSTHINSYGKPDEKGERKNKNAYRCNNKKYLGKENGCKTGAITHWKVEQAFNEYIENIATLKKPTNINAENEIIKQQELSERISDLKNELERCKKKKKQLMQEYANDEIELLEYREMTEIINGKYHAVEQELKKADTKQTTQEESGTISQDDIICNIKDNWADLDDKERMIFLQRFIKKINLRIEKNGRLNTPIIEDIEFNQNGIVIEKQNTRQQKKYKRLIR